MLCTARCADDTPSEKEIEKATKEMYASHKNLDGLLRMCGKAAKVELFEGLPHPYWDKELLKKEEKRPDVFQNHGFGFYSPAIKLPDSDHKLLFSKVTRVDSYTPWLGPRACGGFHPDYLIRFHGRQGVVDLHLCMGCSMAVFYGPKTKADVDIHPSVHDAWRPIPYRNLIKRPQPPAPAERAKLLEQAGKDERE